MTSWRLQLKPTNTKDWSPSGTRNLENSFGQFRLSERESPASLGDPTGLRFASVENAGKTCLVRIWNATDGSLQRTLTGHIRHKGHSRPLWSSDGRHLAAFGWTGSIAIWDVQGGVIKQSLHGHSNAVGGTWLADGQRFLSHGDDGTVRLWDVGSGEEIMQLDADYSAIKFTSDASQLYLLGDTLDLIQVGNAKNSNSTQLVLFAASVLLNRGEFDQAEGLLSSLTQNPPEYRYLLQLVFEARCWQAMEISSAVDGTAVDQLTKALQLWDELLRVGPNRPSVREFGMDTAERVVSLLLQAVNLSAVRANEYGQSIRNHLPIMETVVRMGTTFIADHELPEHVRTALLGRVKQTNQHIEDLKDGFVTSEVPNEVPTQ